MRKSPISIVMALLAICSLLPFGCGGSRKQQEERTHGTIKEINSTGRTLVLKEKAPVADTNDVVKVHKTYRVAFDCHISTATKRKAEFDDLKVGDRINYRFTKHGDEFVIHKITPRGADSGTNTTTQSH